MIIIPDIHGRSFWKDAVLGHETEDIIFLGDYVDPYSAFEPVYPWEGLIALREVLAFKKQHKDNVTLLLGNHDLSYISDFIYRCRHDDENHWEIRNLIVNNLDLFDIALEKKIGNKIFVFSHAGILSDWINCNKNVFGNVPADRLVTRINELFHDEKLYPALGDVSFYRGGDSDAGSCVWADVNEHLDLVPYRNTHFLFDRYQIFGHTLQTTDRPIITSQFACLDCRHAFRLDSEQRLEMIPSSVP